MTISDRTEQPTVLNKHEARAGETSGRMRRVLSISMICTVLAFAAVLGWFLIFR